MKIKHKLLISPFIFTIAFAAFVVPSMQAIERYTGLFEGFYSESIKNMEDVVAINLQFDKVDPVIPKLIIKTMMGEDSAVIKQEGEKYIETLGQIENSLSQIIAKGISSKEKELLSKILPDINAYKAVFASLIKTCTDGDSYGASEKFPNLEEVGGRIKENFHELMTLESSITERSYHQALQTANKLSKQTLTIMAVLSVCFVVVAVFIGIALVKTIILPINNAVQFAENMAKGDYSQKNEIKNDDELGHLGEALNRVSSSFGNIISQIATDVVRLSSSSHELNSVSKKLQESSNASSQDTNSVAAAAEEMSANMGIVAASTEQVSVNMQVVSEAIHELKSTVEKILENTGNASTITENAVRLSHISSEKIDALGLAAQDISAVTDVINGISDKTNLLALNATIEAARAGEAGKGFGVVANEIKALANQTVEATKEIKGKIKEIQKSTGASVDDIKEVANVINSLSDIVNVINKAIDQQVSTTVEIAKNVNQASAGFDEVSENVRQSSQVSTQISQDINRVNTVVSELADTSNQVNHSAGDLAEISETFKSIIGKFKIREDQEGFSGKEEISKINVPDLISWDDSFATNIQQIDSQHQQLMNLINELHRAMKTKSSNKPALAKILNNLIEYTGMHFGVEEELMEKYNYPKFKEHKEIHNALVGQVLDFKSKFEQGDAFISMEIMDFLNKWLVNHIKGIDKEYVPFFHKQGIY